MDIKHGLIGWLVVCTLTLVLFGRPLNASENRAYPALDCPVCVRVGPYESSKCKIMHCSNNDDYEEAKLKKDRDKAEIIRKMKEGREEKEQPGVELKPGNETFPRKDVVERRQYGRSEFVCVKSEGSAKIISEDPEEEELPFTDVYCAYREVFNNPLRRADCGRTLTRRENLSGCQMPVRETTVSRTTVSSTIASRTIVRTTSLAPATRNLIVNTCVCLLFSLFWEMKN